MIQNPFKYITTNKGPMLLAKNCSGGIFVVFVNTSLIQVLVQVLQDLIKKYYLDFHTVCLKHVNNYTIMNMIISFMFFVYTSTAPFYQAQSGPATPLISWVMPKTIGYQPQKSSPHVTLQVQPTPTSHPHA